MENFHAVKDGSGGVEKQGVGDFRQQDQQVCFGVRVSNMCLLK